MRLPDYLSEHHVAFETIVHPPAYSAEKRAKFLHIPGRQVAKSVLLAGPEDYILAVLPATHHIDTDALEALVGGPVRLADHREISDLFRDCEGGVVSPFGPLYGLSTIIDESLDADATLVLESHTHAEAIRMRCRDFERLVKPLRLRFACPVKRMASTAEAIP